MPRIPVRPLVFRTIIALIVVNAAVGIVVIALGSGQVGDTEGNVLATVAFLSLGTLLALPCLIAHEAGRPRPFTLLPSLAVSCIVIAVALAIYLTWDWPADNTLEDIAWSFGFAGAGLAHVCLLSLVRMRRGWLWLQVLAVLLTAALTAMIVSTFWIDLDDGFEDWKYRLFVVTAILTAATSLLVPIVERMLRSRRDDSATARRPSYCPNCGAVLRMDEPRCLACGARFRIEFLDA